MSSNLTSILLSRLHNVADVGFQSGSEIEALVEGWEADLVDSQVVLSMLEHGF